MPDDLTTRMVSLSFLPIISTVMKGLNDYTLNFMNDYCTLLHNLIPSLHTAVHIRYLCQVQEVPRCAL